MKKGTRLTIRFGEVIPYEKLGFTQVGLRKNYYRNPREDALILRKEWSL